MFDARSRGSELNFSSARTEISSPNKTKTFKCVRLPPKEPPPLRTPLQCQALPDIRPKEKQRPVPVILGIACHLTATNQLRLRSEVFTNRPTSHNNGKGARKKLHYMTARNFAHSSVFFSKMINGTRTGNVNIFKARFLRWPLFIALRLKNNSAKMIRIIDFIAYYFSACKKRKSTFHFRFKKPWRSFLKKTKNLKKNASQSVTDSDIFCLSSIYIHKT